MSGDDEEKSLLGAGRRAINVLMRDVNNSEEQEAMLLAPQTGGPQQRPGSYRMSKLLVVSEGDDMEEEEDDSITCTEQMSDTMTMIGKRLPYYIPCLHWMPRYKFKEQFLADCIAAISVGLVLVPQCLSYSLVMGVSPIIGFYSGWMPLVVYFFMGTSKDLIVGPEGVYSLLVGTTIHNFATKNNLPTDVNSLGTYAAALSIVVGTITLILGLIRVGFMDNLVSRPIVCGYINACAFLLFVGQLGTFFGITVTGKYAFEKLASFFSQIGDTNPITLVMGLASLTLLAFVEFTKRRVLVRCIPWSRSIPTTFIVLIFGVILSASLGLHSLDVDTFGKLPTAFPRPKEPDVPFFIAIPDLLVPGFFICLVGFVEAMAVSKQFCIDNAYHVSPNRELVAFGLMNVMGGLFQAFPATASMPRSKISNASGATSQFTGLIASCLPLIMATFGMPVLFYIPKVTISALVLAASMRLANYREIYFLVKMGAWAELVVLFITLSLTFLFGPEIGVLVAFGMSLMMLVKTSSRAEVSILGHWEEDPQEATKYRDVLLFSRAKTIPGILILKINSPLIFINMASFRDRIERAERLGSTIAHPYDDSVLEEPIETIIIDASNVTAIDSPSALVITDMAAHYQNRNVKLLFANLRPNLRYKLLVAASVWKKELDSIGPQCFFSCISAALEFAKPSEAPTIESWSEGKDDSRVLAFSSYSNAHG